MGRPTKKTWIIDYTADMTTTVEAETEEEAMELSDNYNIRRSAEVLDMQLHSVTLDD